MKLSKVMTFLFAPLVVMLLLIAAAIFFGGPKEVPPMASINNPFKSVDFSDVPPLQRFEGKDGASLGYRLYAAALPTPKGSVVLVHGSSASSSSMHPMAKAFARAGYQSYTLDIRGHGESGPKGNIAYVGQLEDDMAAFVKAATPPVPTTLAGFSSGGGFVLRIAANAQQDVFSNYLLLSPFLSQDAPTQRPDSGGWVNVGVPRIIALSVLNGLGLKMFNELPVTRFALSEDAKDFLTPAYSFALSTNFRPNADWAADIRAISKPCAIVVGSDDEAFIADKFESTVRAQNQNWPVTIVPGIAHIPLTLEPVALAAAIAAVDQMNKLAGSPRT